MTTYLLGIDLAWNGNNASALAYGVLKGSSLKLIETICKPMEFATIQEAIVERNSLNGIAIDAPLIIKNETGQRFCENEISKKYSINHAGCHSMSLKNPCSKSLVKLSRDLNQLGFKHLNQAGKWQIEVYPHPAMVEIFSLEKTIKYKKGNVESRKQGQIMLAEKLRSLKDSNLVQYDLTNAEKFLGKDWILSLKGNDIKQIEDILDSIFCLYIAACYQLDSNPSPFGNVTSGYIYVPRGKNDNN